MNDYDPEFINVFQYIVSDVSIPETDDYFWPKVWKTMKVWFTDFISMAFIIWVFGRSLMYWVTILECAFILSMMFLPERIFSPYKSFLWHITLR